MKHEGLFGKYQVWLHYLSTRKCLYWDEGDLKRYTKGYVVSIKVCYTFWVRAGFFALG